MSIQFKPDRTAFEAEVKRRGITHVVHFTPTINLISIYEQSELLSREQLMRLALEYPDLHLADYVEVNDRLRLDNLNNYLNLSIQHPNHWLFRKFRDSCRNWCDSWCVIALKPECLWYADTLFSIGNAAATYSKRHGIAGDYSTFCSLFQDQVVTGNVYSQRTLTRMNLAACYPTDAQAEVLVKGRISTDCVTEVFFETQEEANRSRGAVSLLVDTSIPPFTVNPEIFEVRGPMAKRPVFIAQDPANQDSPMIDVVIVDFQWFPGMAKSHKQKSIDSLHEAIQNRHLVRVLEISSKSRENLGTKLSAFNLGFVHPKSNTLVSVESAFQGSKVFASTGPFPELYSQTAQDAKKFFKDKDLGALVRFNFYGQSWPLIPMTLFYDWLYLNSLNKNPAIATQILEYDCFTDIEFNPKKSINCQAYSAALYVSLSRRGILDHVLEDRDAYIQLMKESKDWIISTEYIKHHPSGQIKLL